MLKAIIAKIGAKILDRSLRESGFRRTDDMSSKESLLSLLDWTLFDKEHFRLETPYDEVYIAKGKFFGSDKPYVVYFRGNLK